MLSHRVSARASFNQPLFALLLAGLSCALSLWLTLRFCRQLWPDEGGVVLMLLGLTWELAKLHFGPVGVQGLFRGRFAGRLGSLLLATMAVVLMAGSVAASMAYLGQADAQDHRRALSSSRPYNDARTNMQSLDVQLAVLAATATSDAAHGYRRRALATSDAMIELRRQRAADSAVAAGLEMHPEQLTNATLFVSLGALLPGDAHANAKCIRALSYAVIAVMLELISVAALCLARVHRMHRRDVDAPNKKGGSPKAAVHLVGASDAAAPIRAAKRPARGESFSSLSAAHEAEAAADARVLVLQNKVAPTYRSVQRALGVGQAAAQRLLADMHAQGLLKRVGRRYHVIA